MNEPELDGLKPYPFCGRRSTMATSMKMDVIGLVVKEDE